jgi:hypothetical protein
MPRPAVAWDSPAVVDMGAECVAVLVAALAVVDLEVAEGSALLAVEAALPVVPLWLVDPALRHPPLLPTPSRITPLPGPRGATRSMFET